MGVDTQRPPLPAPTEPSTLDSGDNETADNESTLNDDVNTNLSTRTDKSTYSIPDDGSPVTINTTKRESTLHKKFPSQTSLLIEYFEGGKSEGKPNSRPSVRVRVTPSSRKNKSAKADHVQITQTSRNARKPSYTRRISLGSKGRDEIPHTEESSTEGSNVSSLPPVEIEVLQNASDLSSNAAGNFNPMASDISSMPADSLLGGEPVIKPPGRRRSRSLEREDVSVMTAATDTLKAPPHKRNRSLSKERITARVMEKLQQKPVETSSSKIKSSRDESTSSRKRRSKSSRDEELGAISGTESSIVSSNAHRRSAEIHSTRSGVSAVSSINNPKLLATVEDAIKRLILPELNALKEEQRTQKNQTKFDNRDSTYETVASTTSSRDGSKRRVSKSSSAPHIHDSKPKVVLNRDAHDPGTVLSGGSSHKERRSSRGSISDRSHAETLEEKVRRKKSKEKSSSSRDACLVGAGLTSAALKSHNSREDHEERKERKKKSKASRSRTASISESVEEDNFEERIDVPPLPMLRSEIQGSEMTRDSILSAETETRERPHSSSSRDTGIETPLLQVPRGYASPTPRTPTRTPVTIARALGTAHSNHSQDNVTLGSPKSAKSNKSPSSRSREYTTATVEAAAAAKIRAIENTEPQRSQYEIDETTPTRGLSPIQSEASYREHLDASGSPRSLLRPVHSGASISTTGRKVERQQSNLSIQSFESTPSTKAARTRKRPQGVTLERSREVLGGSSTGDADDFFAQNHEQNEMYRRELEASELGSPDRDYQRMSGYTDGSVEEQVQDRSEEKLTLSGQDIQKVGSNPEIVHTPFAVESNVASLVEQSNLDSVRSSVVSPIRKSRLSQVISMPDYQHQHIDVDNTSVHEHPSHERWGVIRDQARTLSEKSGATNSPRQSLAKSIDEHSVVHASANAIPTGDVMPEIGHWVDDESEIMTNPSIIKGPIGGGDYYDHADELLSRQEDRERTPTQPYGKIAALGGTAASAMAAATLKMREREQSSPASYQARRKTSVEEDYNNPYAGEPQHAQHHYDKDRTPSRSPALWKDEGYQSANQPAITPEGRNRSKMLEDDGYGEYDNAGLDSGDIFGASDKHQRHMSGNSHGMDSPLYDSATGKGLDRIESKDIVALMDHLTVRDAQRNARDTEILVTLVRSAAEMRNTFEEMRQFIKVQDQMIMSSTDKRIDLAEQRILGGPRPQPLGSPRSPRAPQSSNEDVNVDIKKKSVFKRALKGLSMKSDGDIKKIEAMLVQLLGEVEGLKQFHQLSLDQQNRSNSLTSYENLRASDPNPESGYEPEGRANTASSPNQSGYLSNPSSRRIQDLHSGFDVPQTHRISTVAEDDEEYAEDGQYENTERMTTPTQEARRASQEKTPPQVSRAYRDSQSQDTTPKRKHKSNSSSMFGIPKISRWSKTTASTNPESLPRNSGSGEQRPYSRGSHSGSQDNIPFNDGQYELKDDDRIRSSTSLDRDVRSLRSPSPLIPDDDEFAMDDPKYKAHRNSLNLQHPQPRPGPTGRHQNQLESQARIFDPVTSPDYDQWGSNPSLARNRMSGGGASHGAGNLSPISSDGGYSQHSASEQQQAPSRPSKILDDGPLIPQPLAGHGQARQMYSSPNEYGGQGLVTPLEPIQEVRYSLETDRGHRVSIYLFLFLLDDDLCR
jgi:hypothetical protein